MQLMDVDARDAEEKENLMDVDEDGQNDEVDGNQDARRLPTFPRCTSAELKVYAFVRDRVIKLLEGDLWHHLLENKELIYAVVSKRVQAPRGFDIWSFDLSRN